MGQFFSGADLKRGALQRAGEAVDGSSEYDALCLKYMNQLYFNIIAGSTEFDVDCGEAWMWARSTSPKILTLQPPFGSTSLGGVSGTTVSVVNGSASGSFAVAPTSSMKDQFLFVDDNNPEKYRILSHTAGQTSFTLDGPYNGSTNSSASFLVLILVYPLFDEEDVLKMVEPFRVYKATYDQDQDRQVFGLDLNSFHRDFPLAQIVSGIPDRFTILKNSDGELCALFNMFVTEQTRVEVDYIPAPDEITDSDTSIPLIPRAFRCALEYGPTAMIMLDKSNTKAEQFYKLTAATLKALVEANRKEQSHINSKSKGVLFPRQEQLRTRQRHKGYIRQGW